MMRQVLFVQGGGGEYVHDAWDNKLVESLRHELGPGYDIRYPRMPNEDDPQFGPWSSALRRELDDLDEGAMLVGHSIGATVLVYTLAEVPPRRPPAGIFLVSMPNIGEDGWPSDDIKADPDLGAKFPAQASVYIYQGSADEIVPASHADLNGRAIPQAAVRKLPGRDHQLDNDMSEVAADIREVSRRSRQGAE